MAFPPSKAERLSEFVKRLGDAPTVATHHLALQLVADMLNAVEDEWSGIPYDPARSFDDGRLYPPTTEFEIESDVPNARCYRQRGHVTYIAANGSIRICKKDGQLIASKAGANGVSL